MGHTLTTRPSLTKLQSLNKIMKVSKFHREGAQGDKHVEKTKVMSSSELKHKTFKHASHPGTATIFSTAGALVVVTV